MARGVDYILKTGVDVIEEKEYELTARLISGIRQYDNITIWGPQTAKNRAAVLSITIDGYEPQDISIYLDQIFDIAVRSGLHCAPYAHETLGTLDKGGTVRISPGYFTTEEEIDACIEAIGIISRGEV